MNHYSTIFTTGLVPSRPSSPYHAFLSPASPRRKQSLPTSMLTVDSSINSSYSSAEGSRFNGSLDLSPIQPGFTEGNDELYLTLEPVARDRDDLRSFLSLDLAESRALRDSISTIPSLSSRCDAPDPVAVAAPPASPLPSST